MPTYVFEDKLTGKQFEEFLTMGEKEEFLKGNPDYKQVLTAPNVISGIRPSTGKLGGFKEVLQRVGEANPGSAVDRAHNTRTSKRVATDRIAKKHGMKNV